MSRDKLIALVLWLSAFSLALWALQDISLGAVRKQMQHLSLGQYLTWLSLNAFVMAVSTQRWRLLMNALSAPIAFRHLLIVRLAGQTISFITPGPQFGGEPLQVYWLYTRCHIAIHKALISLGLDRCFELWVNFSVLLLGALYLLLSPSVAFAQWGQIIVVLLALVLIIPAALFGFLSRPQGLLDAIQRLFKRWLEHPKLSPSDEFWGQTASALSAITTQHRAVLLRALLVSIAGWVFILAELYVLLIFVDVYVDLQGFVFIAVAIRVAMLLPLPGGIGTIEAAVLWCFAMLALDMQAAFALIVLMRLRDIFILGAGFMSLRALHRLSP